MLTKPFEFGPEGTLVGAVFQVTEARQRGVGTVIWGMGMQETHLARKFSRLGVPSLLVRVKGTVVGDHISYAPTLARRGIELCKVAIDELGARQQVREVVAIGTCARAALVLNAASEDERIVGVVVTNMLIRGFGASKLARARRVLSEPKRLLQWIKRRAAPIDGAAPAALPADFDFGVIALDRTLPDLLRRLTDRDVAVHIVCTSGDDSLAILQTRFRSALKHLMATRRVTLQIIRSNLHRVNDDELAAEKLNDGIFKWLKEGKLLTDVQEPSVAAGTRLEPVRMIE
jgi:hypothetical protein